MVYYTHGALKPGQNHDNHNKNIILEVWHVYLDVSVFMLFGFLVAALLYLFFKADKIKNYLGKGRVKPVMLAALFGIPIPLCSCAVIPVATGLKKQGANDGAAMGVVKNIFGTRALAIYLGMISICALAMGALLDLIYRLLAIQPSVVMGKASEVLPYGLELTATLILAALLARSLFK
ncbi:permease [Desulfobacter postgatei]|uniref:permease n=1 Tax=uncultured Desulfobacter sp. TaxID=240139 RepID=UPI00259BC1A9|nr:permease [uncultured Desulfobacter sp.]